MKKTYVLRAFNGNAALLARTLRYNSRTIFYTWGENLPTNALCRLQVYAPAQYAEARRIEERADLEAFEAELQ